MIPNAVVFPLFPIVRSSDTPQCGCNDPTCARVGKHPAVKWRDLKLGDEVPRPEPGAGVGLKTGAAPKGSGVFVVDVDSETALAELDRLGAIPPTFTVATGKGWQLYFEHPGFPVRNSVGALAPSVDVRGEGGFVVAPSSPHRSGRTYEVIDDSPPATPPEWLLAWLRTQDRPTETQHYPGDVDGPERVRRRDLYAKWLREDAPARGPERRGKGDATLFDVVQYGAYDLALPTEDVLELVEQHYDPRCDPPWGDELVERVHHKAHDAKTKSTRPRVEPIPVEILPYLEPPPLPPPRPREAAELDHDGMFWDAWDVIVPPPEYVVGGLIPVGSVGMLVALGSSLKTWTALDIAQAVALGNPWLDYYPVKSGRTLFVDYESGLYELQRRSRILRGQRRISGFGAWPMPNERIDDARFWLRLSRQKDLGLVIIDSIAAGAPGVDENKTEAASPMHLAARYSNDTGTAVAFIHHAKKDSNGDDRAAVRGTTAFFNACDWVYRFDSVSETEGIRRMLMSCIKPGPGPRPDPVPLELSDLKGLVRWVETKTEPELEIKEPVRTPEEIRKAIEGALMAGPIESKDALAKATGIRAELVRPEIDALIVQRRIIKLRAKGYCLDGPQERSDRVCAAVRALPNPSALNQIATYAQVEISDVQDAWKAGIIAKSASKRFIVL